MFYIHFYVFIVLLRIVNFVFPTSFHKVCQELAPLCPELVGARQAAITSNHTQVGDTQLDQVTGSLCATLLGSEILTAGATDHSPSLISGSEERFQTQTGITKGQINKVATIV